MILFLKGRLKGLKYAFKGLYLLFKTEHSIMAQTIIFSLTILLGFILEISKIRLARAELYEDFEYHSLYYTIDQLLTAVNQ